VPILPSIVSTTSGPALPLSGDAASDMRTGVEAAADGALSVAAELLFQNGAARGSALP
jgi:hypothetical protein